MSAAAALLLAVGLAGCGSTTYFAGRTLPPSGVANRVLITIQYPSASSSSALQFVDAYYDRCKYNSTNCSSPAFSIAGYSGALPTTIQNMPEEQLGAVYNSGSGSLSLINYASEKSSSTVGGLSGLSSSIFITSNKSYVFAAGQNTGLLTVVDQSGTSSGVYTLSLPGLYRLSVNTGGSVALAFAQNSNYAYYPRKLTAAQTLAYNGGFTTWPKAAVDCEPQNAPVWCLFQAQSPDHTDSTGNYYGAPLTFDRPVKAVFSADGGTAYVLNSGPEYGGVAASVTPLPVAPMIFLAGQASGSLPATTSTPSAQCGTVNIAAGCVPIPGGASNALVNSSTLYVVGQEKMTDGYWGGHLTVVNLSSNTVSSTVSISDGTAGGTSRMILADNNTLWIGMTGCSSGERAHNLAAYDDNDGCLTMVDIATPTSPIVALMPNNGDATGIAAVTGLYKIYTVEGGQVYIYATGGGAYAAGTAISNQYVTVTGTAYDVAYMDATSDSDNTDY
jgi:hypothetical protein